MFEIISCTMSWGDHHIHVRIYQLRLLFGCFCCTWRYVLVAVIVAAAIASVVVVVVVGMMCLRNTAGDHRGPGEVRK